MDDVFSPRWLHFSQGCQLDKPVDTRITGELPKWITGTLYRNGPGLFKVGETTMKHLFDGFSVLHKFVIKDGKVLYQQKLLDTDTLKRSIKANRLVVTQFATVGVPDPCKNIFSRFLSYFIPDMSDLTDNTSVNIVPQGDMLIAMTEGPFVNVVDPDTLARTDKVDLNKLVAVHMATAHPHTDEEGNMYNLGTAFNPKKAYNIIKVPPQEKGGDNPLKHATLISTFPSRWNFNISYNHSFGMSRNYFIVLEQPLSLNSLKLPLMKIMGKGFESCMTYYPDEKLIFHLVRRSDGKRVDTCYAADSFLSFHFINCYEEDDHVVIDLCAFDSGDVLHDLFMNDMLEARLTKNFGKVRRYVLPLNIREYGETDERNLVTLRGTSATALRQTDGTILCTPDYIRKEGIVMDLPRINYSYNAKKYRYVYGSGFLTYKSGVAKIDFETKTAIYWKPEEMDQAGEPVFISNPAGIDEDDGIILSPVLPVEDGRPTYLVVLDAKNLKEIARAVIPTDINTALSFHGSFVPCETS